MLLDVSVFGKGNLLVWVFVLLVRFNGLGCGDEDIILFGLYVGVCGEELFWNLDTLGLWFWFWMVLELVILMFKVRLGFWGVT